MLLPGLGSSKSGVVREVVLYAPIGFATAAQNTILYLMTAPQTPAATSADSLGLFLSPTGAIIVSAVATNNGTTVEGGSSFDIGYERWSTEPCGTSQIFSGTPLCHINAGVHVGQHSDYSLGSCGSPFVTVGPTSHVSGVTVQVLGSDNTAGDLAVVLRYLL